MRIQCEISLSLNSQSVAYILLKYFVFSDNSPKFEYPEN